MVLAINSVHRFAPKLLLTVAAVCLSVFAPHTTHAEDMKKAGGDTPYNMVQATVDELVQVVGKHPGEANTAARREALKKAIEPRFNFDEMSKRSLGANWTKLTPEEQTKFVALFSDLLALTYLRRIEHIEKDTVKLKSEKQKADRALVRTIIQYKGDTFPLDYKLSHEGGSWKVYDVVIENIGLVSNYRNEFGGIIRKSKVEGLLAMLKEKTEKLRAN